MASNVKNGVAAASAAAYQHGAIAGGAA